MTAVTVIAEMTLADKLSRLANPPNGLHRGSAPSAYTKVWVGFKIASTRRNNVVLGQEIEFAEAAARAKITASWA